MKHQAVQTIETAAIFEFIPLDFVQPAKQIVSRKTKRIQPQLLKPLKPNNQIKLRQLLLPSIQIREQKTKTQQRPNISLPTQSITNCVTRRYSHYDYISRTDRTISKRQTQSLMASKVNICLY